MAKSLLTDELWAVIELVLSFTLPRIAVCECASMMPGVRCLPVASMMFAPAGTVSPLPMAAIFPSRINTSLLVSLPAAALVQTVALRISTVPAFPGGAMPNAPAG